MFDHGVFHRPPHCIELPRLIKGRLLRMQLRCEHILPDLIAEAIQY